MLQAVPPPETVDAPCCGDRDALSRIYIYIYIYIYMYIYILLLTLNFAVLPGSRLCSGERTLPIHWAVMQSCFVRVR